MENSQNAMRFVSAPLFTRALPGLLVGFALVGLMDESAQAARTPVALAEISGRQPGQLFYIDKDSAGSDFRLYVGNLGHLELVPNTTVRQSPLGGLTVDGYSEGSIIIPGKLIGKFKKARIERKSASSRVVSDLSVLPTDVSTLKVFSIEVENPTSQMKLVSLPTESAVRQLTVKENASVKAAYRATNGDLMIYSFGGLGEKFESFSIYYQPIGNRVFWQQSTLQMMGARESFSGDLSSATEEDPHQTIKVEGLVGGPKSQGYILMTKPDLAPVRFSQVSEPERRAIELRVRAGLDAVVAPAERRVIKYVIHLPKSDQFLVIDETVSSGLLTAFIGKSGHLTQLPIERMNRAGRTEAYSINGGIFELNIEPEIPAAMLADKDMREYALKLPKSKLWQYAEPRSARQGFGLPVSIDDIEQEPITQAAELGYDLQRLKVPAQIHPFQRNDRSSNTIQGGRSCKDALTAG